MLPELYKSRNRLSQPKLIYPAISITLSFEPKMMAVSALEQQLRLIVEKAEQQIRKKFRESLRVMLVDKLNKW